MGTDTEGHAIQSALKHFLTKRNVIVLGIEAVKIWVSSNLARFTDMGTESWGSTNPAPTSSVAMPSAVSLPTMNSNLISLSSRRAFLQ